MLNESTQKMQSASNIQNLLKQSEDEMKENFTKKSIEKFFDAALKLCLLFGEELVVEGLLIAENGLVRIVSDEEGAFPQILEVRPGSFCTKSYYIYENINFCNCHFFSDCENMRRILCVAEKHDAAKNIAKFLSNGNALTRPGKGKFIYNFLFNRNFENRNANFVFTSVRGHIMNYEFDRKYKAWIRHQIVDLFEGRIDHIVTANMKEIEANLKIEAKKADTLIIWTDCDREGEHIGKEIVQICCATNPRLDVKRARFSEITNTAIQRAMRNLCRLDEKIVKAVDCRMELDLRIGAAFTRLQTLYFKNERLHTHFGNNVGINFDDFKNVISYGSCQFPTLGFVVERYKDRIEFVREPFWKLMGKDGINPVNFFWERDKLFEKNVVEAIKNACNNSREPAKIIELTKKPKSKWRPQPLDTIQLQRLGSRFLRMNAKIIMNAAEKLYQNGFISYPRTETTSYSADFDLADIVYKLAENIEWKNFALEIQQKGGPKPRNGNKNDQAHPPIHPVKCANKNSFANIDEWKVYEFICRYFLASVSRDATGMETKVKVRLDEEIFIATGLIIEDLGYLLIYPFEKWQDKNIPNYQQGQIVKNFSIIICEGTTVAPPLLSEADLIALMDKKGIGTDATHAEHIETIKKRWYVVVNNERRFEPTKLGLSLVTAYDKMEHRHKISKPYLRAALERDLENICKGTRTKDEVLHEQLKIYKELYNSTEQKINFFTQAVHENAQN